MLHNDTAERWTIDLRIERRGYDGGRLAQQTVALEISARSNAHIPISPAVATPSDPPSELVVAEAAERRATWFFSEYRHSELGTPDIDVIPMAVDGGWNVVIRARNVVRELTLLVDRIDPEATADQAMLTLLPGDERVIEVRGGVGQPATVFSDPLVLRSANDLVAGGNS